MARFNSRRHFKIIRYCKIAILAVAGVMQLAPSVIADTLILNEAQYNYEVDNGPTPTGGNQNLILNGNTNQLNANFKNLLDPLGRIEICAGKRLGDYQDFKIGLYETFDRGLTLSQAINLPTNQGVSPNAENNNPLTLLSSNNKGAYSFTLNPTQAVVGKTYVLVVKPPTNTSYAERRILIEILENNNNQIKYRAQALDGKSIDSSSADQTVNTSGLFNGLSIVSLSINICDANPISIIKSADRVSAEPGDTVVYRLLVRNLSPGILKNAIVRDTLPLGLKLQTNIVKAKDSSGADVPITVTQSGNNIEFKIGTDLAANATINIAYATTITVDALRGTGRNLAVVEATQEGSGIVKDGPVSHQLTIRNGIISNTGTILGRVFVDKNFDGEQQSNEPGIPNAVVFLDDGNRITTDANGMFSVACVISGSRTGVLDLTSLPGYTLAPNLYFKERNSQSRLVRLSPGGLQRMNFGVTPTSREIRN